MKQILTKFSIPEKGNDPNEEEELIALLDELDGLCLGVEGACDLVRIGGLPQLMNVMFDSHYEKVRKEAYFVFANLNQNNNMVQVASMESGGFLLFNSFLNEINILNKENAFGALSSLVRGDNFESKRQFIDADGIEFIVDLLKNDKHNSLKLKTKSVLLLNDLLHYDDNLHYKDNVEYNKQKDKQIQISLKVNNGIISENNEESKSSNALGLIPLSKQDQIEELKMNISSDNNSVKVKNLIDYKGIVKRKLKQLNFITLIRTCINDQNLDKNIDFRSQFLSAVLSFIQNDKTIRLSKVKIFLRNH